MAKIYSVMKNGELLEEAKTLTAAKKLADAEEAEVYCDGKCVYPPQTGENPEDKKPEELATAPEEKQPVQYRLKALMNVRKGPSLNEKILGTKKAGTIVSVRSIEKDWMCLTDGTFILYQGGKFAEKA